MRKAVGIMVLLGTIAVIAVDPSSARSGGALLGDRTRLTTDPADTGVFVRSMAARDRLGGVAAITFPAMVRHALPSFGNNWLVLTKTTALVSVIGLQDMGHPAHIYEVEFPIHNHG